MSAKLKTAIVSGILVATISAALGAGKAVPTGRRPANTITRPPSLYELYTRLKGSREFCYLPSEPCDNNRRVQN